MTGSNNKAKDLVTLASFIAWHDPDSITGGYSAQEAWDALCQLLELPPDKLMNIVKPADLDAETMKNIDNAIERRRHATHRSPDSTS